ncbi:5-formyltetrahydrofolate cyclo-ligase [Mycobacterium sp. IDR2000157661]|uniref:5-formyltetrahydrofolate cyclo-ligase n=1 Tax=Mycobacterium sp. IDR2000157661 TaxID=2867005 RepID=UPI001EE9D382|nr:5-formyltetrahydrofolate cyclo-ligase [Mycobacterium sp. IDR2000157661]ULE31285.1 5-formyltetrahydrofolate cyclo-ligase [Mycobacterium sp. IDR2000157661]
MSGNKAELREAILAARRAVPAHEHDAEAHALALHAANLVEDGQTVCAYAPVGSEPGSLELVDVLHRRRVRVLLPVAHREAADSPGPLRWGDYVPGELVRARFGLLEPAQPWLPPETVAVASLLLVPALAVDRFGVRLGRGAGFYDRTLPLASPSARRVAVVRDDEIVDRLPTEPHDIAMTHALTPRRGPVPLGAGMRPTT